MKNRVKQAHEAVHFDWQAQLRPELEKLAALARQSGVRLSMHPGQYTVLNSPREDVVRKAVADWPRHAEQAGLDEETVKNLTQGFAVGMGGSMEATCGAIIGAVNVLGMINKNPQKTMQSARRIISRFKEQNGTVICKELKGIADGVVRRECIDCVKDAAVLLEDELK